MTDPLTEKPVEVLWVKGSGGDLGSMKLDGFATLYLDKLEALKGLYRGSIRKTRWCTTSTIAPSISIRAPPRSTRRLHGFVPATPCRSRPCRCGDRHRRLEGFRKAHARKFSATRSGYLPWQRPGFDLGIKLGEMASEHPDYVRRRARQPRPVHLGRGLPRAAMRRRLRIINKAARWLEQNAREAGLRRRSVKPPRSAGARAAVAQRLHAAKSAGAFPRTK